MIRVSRGEDPEPVALRRARYHHLARLRARIAMGEIPSRSDFCDYAHGKAQILTAQHERCAFCERPRDGCEVDVEHFRPCSRYWWLAWSWDNQLAACKRCNGSSHKGDNFPLRDEARRLVAEEMPPGAEEPLLIDPSAEDPIDHIQFKRVAGLWVPVPRNGSVRGRETIKTLGLRLFEPRYTDHWVDFIKPRIDMINDAIRSGVARRIHRTWQATLNRLFRPQAIFQALAYDALKQAFPDQFRAQWQLDLPRPGAVSCVTHAEEFADELGSGSREAVYRLPAKASAAEMQWAVLVLCAERPMTYRELARYLTRRKETVAACVRSLVDQGRLQRMGHTKPYRFALTG